MAPFLFAMNEVYLRDGSRKMEDMLRSKRESGQYCACPPCELMWVDGAIRALIQKGRAVQMDQAVRDDGIVSISMERALADLLGAGTISSGTYEQALGGGLAEQAAGRVKAGRPG